MAIRFSLWQAEFPNGLIGENTGQQFYDLNAVHRVVCHGNEDPFSAVKPDLTEAVPGRVLICNNFAHALFYQNHPASSKYQKD